MFQSFGPTSNFRFGQLAQCFGRLAQRLGVELHALLNKRPAHEIRISKVSALSPDQTRINFPPHFTTEHHDGSMQKDLYNETFRGLIGNVLDGFNGTIFAYGQTGTGKTFTIQGLQDNPELRGIMPNSFVHIFDEISKSVDTQYLVRASYMEIYKEEIRDLLRRDQSKHLEIREKPDSGIYIKDLSSVLTKSIDEILKVMTIGYQNRAVG
ncbi:hypothetical protein MN116_004116 [Schistosoma mekongi]|uniref:Kinesin motor domain-containing protein n=1 Tax=Schistosoma mekongi TaxID=38744 RepID=A0AAE1ZF34_SCHME|nr:hypothetical protein MN116_004116 [Schistosoma mekongi]